MIGIIFIILFWFLTAVISLQGGAEIVAADLWKKHRINSSEYKELISWKFLFTKIKE